MPHTNGNGKKNGLLLTDFELEVMNNLWTRGKASASRIQMDMIRSGLMYAYPSVYSVLRKFTRTGKFTKLARLPTSILPS